MFLDIINIVIAIIMAVVFACCGYWWVMDTYNDVEYSKFGIALMIGVLAGFIGFCFWTIILCVSIGMFVVNLLFPFYQNVANHIYDKIILWRKKFARFYRRHPLRFHRF